MEIRLYTPGDLDGCLALLREGHDPDFSEARFRWLHEKGPWGPSQAAVAIADGRIVGMYSVLPKAVFLNAREFRGARDIDPIVHPSQRGKGVFGQLLEFGLEHFEELDFLFNFANPASARGFRRHGWKDAPPLEDRVRQIGYRSLLSQDGLLHVAGRLRPAPNPPRHVREVEATELRNILESDSRFARPDESPGFGGVPRGASYLAWRYLDHPFHDYRYFQAEDDRGGVALAVVRHLETSGQLTVLDLAGFGMLPHLTAFDTVWAAAFPHARAVAWHTLPAPTLSGFIGKPGSRGRGQTFLVRDFPGGAAPDQLRDSGNWFLTRGDLEIS